MPLLCQRSQISDDLFELSKVTDFSITAHFDGGDDDLNEFFQADAVEYRMDLLAETYVFYLKGKEKELGPFAFVALANDVIRLSKPMKRKFIHHKKRYIEEYPAVKIARLGVNGGRQRKGVGTHLLNLLKILFKTENRTGCRFMTVDAYNREPVLSFYKKNEFEFLHQKDSKEDSRIMFYDLKRFVPPKNLKVSS